MHRLILLLVGVAGCNQIFGVDETGLREYFDAKPRPDADPRVDLDNDGIKDVADPCIAPETDALINSDGDTLPNGGDSCPFDSAAQPDGDSDGIGDACDPEPTFNRVRCVMAFSDPDLNFGLWKHGEEAVGWILHYPRMLHTTSAGMLVADFTFEANGVTVYDVAGQVYSRTTHFGVIPRVGDVPDDQVGCALVHDASGWSIKTSSAPSTLVSVSTNPYDRFHMRIVLDPATPGFTCAMSFAGEPTVTIASDEAISPGNFGLYGDHATVHGIGVYER